MSRWFHVAFFADPLVQRVLDHMIFLLDPDKKMPAHITLRGPFKTARTAYQNVVDLTERHISILGVGRFPAPQTTVFLHCGSNSIEERWWKPDYGYNPHITIYDGPSLELSRSVYSTLNEFRFFATTRLAPIEVYGSLPGQKNLRLRLSIDFAELSETAGFALDDRKIEELTEPERIACLKGLASRLRLALEPRVSKRLA